MRKEILIQISVFSFYMIAFLELHRKHSIIRSIESFSIKNTNLRQKSIRWHSLDEKFVNSIQQMWKI